jgi:hypothetical protein
MYEKFSLSPCGKIVFENEVLRVFGHKKDEAETAAL